MRVSPNAKSQSEWQERSLEHLRYEYDLGPEDIVIDIGSYRGEWSAGIHARYGCRMVGVEPTPYNDFHYFEWFENKAASDRDGIVKVGGAYYYTSAHEEPTHEYPCFDLNSLLAKYDEIALLKMNVEGDEYKLIPHMIKAGLHTGIRDLQVQFHEIEGEHYRVWYELIRYELNKTHRLTWSYPFCWENWTRLR